MFRVLLITITMLLYAPSAFSASSIYRDSTVYRSSSIYGSNSSAISEKLTIIGLDVVAVDVSLKFVGSDEKYSFQTLRLRYGAEIGDDSSYGFELKSGGQDEVLDSNGDLNILEASPSLGVYGTIGAPLYFRVGLTAWESTYTNTTNNSVRTQIMSGFDYGVGLKFSMGHRVSVYADYTVRETSMDFLTGVGLALDEVGHSSGLFSLGLNINF